MPTYSKETALFDTGKIGNDIEGAGETASAYMTEVSSDGVFVHEYDADGQQPTDTGANGVHISNDVDIIRNGEIVASYGNTARIGLEDDSHVEIDATGQRFFSVVGGDVSKSFEVATSGIVEQTVVDDYKMVSYGDLGRVVVWELTSVPDSGATITISDNFPLNPSTITFTYGTSSANRSYSNIYCFLIISYDGNKTFTVTMQSWNTQWGNYAWLDISYSATIVSPFFSLGTRAGAPGSFSAIIGKGLYAENDNQVAIGAFNTKNASMLFQVGKGTSDSARSDAFGVDTSGYIYPAGVKMVDYVIEDGIDGSWQYRKWKKGRIEAWYVGNVTMSATTSTTSGVYYRTATLDVPSGIFNTAPRVIVGSANDDNTIIAVKGYAESDTSIKIRDYRTNQNSSTQSRSIRVYAWNGESV